LELKKLLASLRKEHAALSSSRMIYATACHNIDGLAVTIKELNTANKKLAKRIKGELCDKYSHNERMM
jgi:hypothetical protein